MNPLEYVIARLRTIDPKIVAVAVGYLLTLLVVRVGLDLNAVLIPGYLTVQGAIALSGALVLGWWKSNVATILRTPQDNGNPDAKVVAKNLSD